MVRLSACVCARQRAPELSLLNTTLACRCYTVYGARLSLLHCVRRHSERLLTRCQPCAPAVWAERSERLSHITGLLQVLLCVCSACPVRVR